MMIIGACRITLRLPENHSLKGKRHIVKPIIERLKSKFDVAAAEVEDNDRWQMATIGVACVANNQAHANSVLSSVAHFVEESNFEIEVLEIATEFVHVL